MIDDMRTVVVLSGGLDSTVLLYLLRQPGKCGVARAVTIDYGQRHRCEIQAARHVAELCKVPHDVVPLDVLGDFLPGSSQTDRRVDVPEGHYQDAMMRKTVVPNRNMILLSVALAIAVAHDIESVAYAAHFGDHAIYPDCRAPFIVAMQEAARLCDYKRRRLLAPFAHMDKAEIVRIGARLDVPFRETWSCYKGGREVREGKEWVISHCGKCGACVERREAFRIAGVPDPTDYEAP